MSLFTTWFDMQHSSPAYNIARANGSHYKLYGNQVEKAVADPSYSIDSTAKLFGTSYESTSRFAEPPKDATAVEAMRSALGMNAPIGSTSSGSGAGSGYGGSSPVTYSDWSPAAKLFGMDQSTAYEEHLANTAHQREVADLKAAGLNPVLGLGSGASGVSGSPAGSGSGSGYAASAKKIPVEGIADVVGSVAGLLVTIFSKNRLKGEVVASATAKAAASAGRVLDDIINE